MTGTVEEIWTAEAGSEPMETRDAVTAVAEGGLRGDRYFEGTGYYSAFDTCEVTLIAAEALAAIRDEAGIDLTDGRHRRNLVTRGVDPHDLLETRFRAGEAVLEGTRPRPPCAYVEELAGESGVKAALGDGRAGICASVVETGEIEAGDELRIVESLDADPDDLAAAIRERQD
ncbi:MOSC domain-containing protein [Halobacteriales archaeon QS_1_68_17]|nr:MAG: MOSC domain-containing protein [Halobacteriales archaeon QS_1_68_17]